MVSVLRHRVAMHIRRPIEATAGILVLAAVIGSSVAWSQSTSGEIADRERALVESIQRGEENGPYSEELLGPLTALSLHYEEVGDYRAADATIERVLQVVRAHYGLYALEQAPSIRRLISHEDARGNVVSAWDLEHELLRLVERHPNDVRSAQILRESGDKRLDILRRYDAGERVPEIILGCYYVDTTPVETLRTRGSRPLLTYQPPQSYSSCASGSRRQARRSLLREAQTLYVSSVDIIVDNQGYSGDELRDYLTELVRTSYRYGIYALGRIGLGHLVAYESENSQELLPRARMRVLAADWDLFHSSAYGASMRNAALEAYQIAYDSLAENGVSQASIDEIFAPEVPVTLPAFAPSALVAEETPESTGYVDVTFVVAADGRAEDVEVVDAAAVLERSDVKTIVNAIKRSRFRPRIADGRLADSDPVAVRYYFSE